MTLLLRRVSAGNGFEAHGTVATTYFKLSLSCNNDNIHVPLCIEIDIMW